MVVVVHHVLVDQDQDHLADQQVVARLVNQVVVHLQRVGVVQVGQLVVLGHQVQGQVRVHHRHQGYHLLSVPKRQHQFLVPAHL